jgi:NAD(P)-dependent dehydrogenase (short-subunit alcohol dehydrogenase family)
MLRPGPRRAVDTIVGGPIALSAGAVLPVMIKNGWGRIVNVSSGVVGNPGGMIGGSTYAATKAALEAQTISMAAEYAGTGVTINVYRPGGVDTAMQEWIRAQDPAQIGEVLHDRFLASHASGNLLSPETSGQALVAHLGLNETGRIWDVNDLT